MNEVTKPEPVDNSHLDAGVAARDAQKAAEQEAVVEEAVEAAEEAVESDEGEQGESQNTEESADSEQGDAKAKPRNRGVGKRIDELTKEKYDAQRERDYWREQAIAQTRKVEPPEPAVQVAENDGEPTLEDCNFDPAEFNRRHYKWMREQERAEERNAKAQAEAQELFASFQEKQAAFAAEHPDYEQVVHSPLVPLTQAVSELIFETDDPPAIAYYLGKHLDEAIAIAQMTPTQAARAIGRIEAGLSAPVSQPIRQPEPKTVTRAPAPVTTLSGAPAVKKSYDDMSQEEYELERNRERAAKGLR